MKNLKRLRTERHITQMELAFELGIPQSTYQQYESGVHEADYAMLIQIADYFDVSIDYLLGRTDIRTPAREDTIEIATRVQQYGSEFQTAALALLEQIERIPRP